MIRRPSVFFLKCFIDFDAYSCQRYRNLIVKNLDAENDIINLLTLQKFLDIFYEDVEAEEFFPAVPAELLELISEIEGIAYHPKAGLVFFKTSLGFAMNAELLEAGKDQRELNSDFSEKNLK